MYSFFKKGLKKRKRTRKKDLCNIFNRKFPAFLPGRGKMKDSDSSLTLLQS